MDAKPTYEELLNRVKELERQESGSRNTDSAFSNREPMLRSLIETIPDLIWLKDPDGVFLACNRRFERFYGAKEEDIVGKTDYDFVPKELADSFRANDLAAIAEGKPRVNEETVTYADDGHEELLETIKTPMYDPAGTLIGVLGVSRDITERKRIERELRISEARLRLTLDVANIGIWDWDVANDYWYASPIYYTMLGYEPVSGISDREVWLERVHPDDLEKVKSKIQNVLQSGDDDYNYEARMRHADGTYRWHSIYGYVLERDKKGKPIHLIGRRVDIDERMKAEAEKERLQAQLTQAHKMEAIGRLAGGVAHDFNNMLSVIMGRTELLLSRLDPSQPMFADIQEIGKAARNSADLTKQLLAFARKQAISPKVVDLNAVVESMSKMLQRIIGEDINFAWVPGEDLWSVLIDSSQVDQILANLCVNARDSIRGVGKIVIETANKTFDEAYCHEHAEFKPGDYVMLSVGDNGCGMDGRVVKRIFEPFFTTKGEGKGTGLGLATVYGIVRQNSGHINVYSEPGYGSTFKIYLPRYMAEADQWSPKNEATQLVGGSETILVVEDNYQILKISQAFLEGQGYKVLTSVSAGQALELVDSYNGVIDLLITDVIMPDMSGLELAENLKMRRPEMGVLYISGYTANIVARQGVIDQDVHFLQKPFTMRELAAKVRESMAKD